MKKTKQPQRAAIAISIDYRFILAVVALIAAVVVLIHFR